MAVPDGGAVRVALLGCGVVGTEVARLLLTQGDDLAARAGARLELVGIAVRDLAAPRDPVITASLLTDDAEALVDRADVVVEVMGGIEPARALLLRAIAGGAAVVTANKALLGADIGQATGILMERFDMPSDRAFGLLSKISQDNNLKLRQLAEQIVQTRAVPKA